MKAHNPYYRDVAELKSAILSALSPENGIQLVRSVLRDCLYSKDHREKDQAWHRLFALLDIVGVKSVSPDECQINEAKIYLANPPSLVERAMRGGRTPTSTSKVLTPMPATKCEKSFPTK